MRHVVLCLSFALCAAGSAAAQGPIDEVRAGVYAQSCCGPGTSKEQGAAFNTEVLFSSPRFLSVLGAPRPLIGATLASDPDATNQAYAGLEWRLDLASRWFVAASVGGAIHDGETDDFDPVADAGRVDSTVFFGCRAHFRLAGDAGYRVTRRISTSVHWNHISNAGLCRENEGLDQLGARVGVRF